MFLDLSVLDKKERGLFVRLIIVLFLLALMEVLGITSIFPILMLLMDPSILMENERFAQATRFLPINMKQNLITYASLISAIVFIFSIICRLLIAFLLTKYRYQMEARVASNLLTVYLNRPYAWYKKQNIKHLSETVLSEVSHLVASGLLAQMRMIAHFFTIAFLFVAMMFLSWQLTLTAAVIFSISFIGFLTLTRSFFTAQGERSIRANEARFNLTGQALEMFLPLKLNQSQDVLLSAFQLRSQEYARAQIFASIGSEMPRYVLESIIVGSSLVGVAIWIEFFQGDLQLIIPIFSVFALISLRLMPSVQQTIQSASLVEYAKPYLKRIFNEIKDANEDIILRGGCSNFAGFELNSLNVRLEKDRWLWKQNLSFQIETGQFVGVIGPSGSGKTSLINMLLGIQEPDVGSAYIWQGEQKVQLKAPLVEGIGYVPQKVVLIQNSIAWNIALAEYPQVDSERLVDVAKICAIDEFIEINAPASLDQEIALDGLNFSGGQGQRIGIARALYNGPNVLFLDEAFNGLDSGITARILESLRAQENLTIVLITHNLSEVRDCDMVIDLEQLMA